MLKTFYDVCCSNCSRYLSKDYREGMVQSKQIAIKQAKLYGWEVRNQKDTICPLCIEKMKAAKGETK